MAALGPVVHSLPSAVNGGKSHLVESRRVRLEMVGDEMAWSKALLLQKFPHQLLGSSCAPAGLDQAVKNLAFGVDSSPQIHPLSANRDEHLVQMPLSMWARPARAKVSRNRRTKPGYPLADRFVADLDAAFYQQIFNIAEAQSV